MQPRGARLSETTDPVFLRNFIEEYRKHECLWNQDHKHYRCKTERDRAFDDILIYYRTVVPDAQRSHVVRKVLSLRSSHQNEQRKIVEERRRGRIHVPKLWYYEQLSFINSKYMLNLDDRIDETKFNYSKDKVKEEDSFESSRDPLTILPSQRKEAYELLAITAFSEYTAARLYTVSPSQRFVAQRLISEILHLASSGALTENFKIMNKYDL